MPNDPHRWENLAKAIAKSHDWHLCRGALTDCWMKTSRYDNVDDAIWFAFEPNDCIQMVRSIGYVRVPKPALLETSCRTLCNRYMENWSLCTSLAELELKTEVCYGQ